MARNAAVSAWIETNDRPTPIYSPRVHGTHLSGWIESKVGDEFSVCYKLAMEEMRHDLEVEGCVDGPK